MSQDIEKALAGETDKLVDTILKSGVDGIIGGFPCQDISVAGGRKGIQRNAAGEATTRSGLFWTMVETVRLVRPRYWLMENVAELFNRGMGTVIGEVASIGYHAEWDCVGAGTVGAPHHRARAYILAYDNSIGWERKFPKTIQRQPDFDCWKDVRGLEELRNRRDLFRPNLSRKSNGLTHRLHAIGNGNPPCVIRELTRGLK